jgi:hypothetical protein
MDGIEVFTYVDAEQHFPDFVFGDLSTNRKGGKSVYIYRSAEQRRSPQFQLCLDDDAKLRAPFGLSSYDEPTDDRRDLVFSIENEALAAFFARLDVFLQDAACHHSPVWFKKTLTSADVASMYRPVLTPNHKGYPPTVKTKVNIAGANQVRVWKVLGSDPSRVVEGSPADIVRTARFMPVVALNGCWFLSRQTGVTLTCTDLLVFPEAPRPFLFRTNLQLAPAGGPAEEGQRPVDDEVEPDTDAA